MELKNKIKGTFQRVWRPTLGCLCFLLVLWSAFRSINYLLRPTTVARNTVTGIKQEEPLDMVYVGGSAAYDFWQPLKAWNDCGLASYSYATSSITAEALLPYIQDVRRFQEPELFVIDVRPFQYYRTDSGEASLRNGTDSMDMTSPARYRLLRSFLANNTLGKTTAVWPYYLEIMKYHTLTEGFADRENWMYINNTISNPDKGWEWVEDYAILEQPRDFETEERRELQENARALLEELLDYGKRENLNFLFVVCPYAIDREQQAKYNTIGDLVEQSGYRFLNANDYLEEMGLDYGRDFYNINHVNAYGAEKYTAFLEAYIADNYRLPDRREDPAYAAWNEDYNAFESRMEDHKVLLDALLARAEATPEKTERLRQTQDLAQWVSVALSGDYDVVMVSGDVPEGLDEATRGALSELGLGADTAWQMRFLPSVVSQEHIAEPPYAQISTAHGKAAVTLSATGESCSVTVNDDCLVSEAAGIHLVAIDTWRGTVADRRSVYFDE